MNKVELIIVLAVTGLVVFVWVFSNVFFTPPQTTPDTNVQGLLEPVTPAFDQDTLNRISAIQTPGPSQAPGASVAPTPSPTPTGSPAASAKVSPTPEGTASASAKPAL